MTPTRPIPALLLLAALLASCSDGDPPAVAEKAARPDEPPPHLVAKYGPQPAGGPTGRRRIVEGIEFIELKPGYFLMGGPPLRFGPLQADSHGPLHWVQIPDAFWMAKTEVPNSVYERSDEDFKRSTDSPGRQHPAGGVSWDDAVGFCSLLSDREKGRFRLPSEAEWEYACRAGNPPLVTHDQFNSFLFNRANFADRTFFDEYFVKLPEEEQRKHGDWVHAMSFTTVDDGHVHAAKIASFGPNSWGFHDMLGNLWEWCEDDFLQGYKGAPADGSPRKKPDGMGFKVLRGGSWNSPIPFCSPTERTFALHDARGSRLGFRPVAIFPE
jgi:formylglycine-generating enzyme required for sulfatase activity